MTKQEEQNAENNNAHVRNYFETDAHSRPFRSSKLLSINYDENFNIKRNDTGIEFNVTVSHRIFFDYEANSIYSSFFIPEIPTEIDIVAFCKSLTNMYINTPLATAPPAIQQNSINLRDNEADVFHHSHKMINSRLISIYIDMDISKENKEQIYQYADLNMATIKIRDQEYVNLKSAQERPLAFISHDSRDKDNIARPLAQKLTEQIGRIWFDEFSLKLGASLRESIEKGIKECNRCILILSPNFLNNNGWTKTEFNSIFTRELIERENIIIPIWVDVSVNEIYNYSPSLADKLAVNWNEGIDKVCQKIKQCIYET